MVTVHTPKPVSDVCVTQEPPTSRPVFRAPIGGGQVESAIDTTKGIPGACSLNFSILTAIQPALAGIQPVLSILDAVATMANCVALMSQVFTNPTKIQDLLGCLPALFAKINQLLDLIPPFPTGYRAIITSVVDALRVAQQSLTCVSLQLTSVQRSLEQVERDIASLTALPEGPFRDRMSTLITCGMEQAEQTVSTATASLGPIARVICAIRTIMVLQGDQGKELAERLSLPDVSNPANLQVAIDAINLLTQVIDVAITIAETLGAPFGAPLPAPPLVFDCPLDNDDSAFDTTPPEPLPQAEITSLLDALTGTPIGGLPPILSGSADVPVILIGTGFINTDQSVVYFGADPLAGSVVNSATQITVTIPAANLTNSLTTFLNVVNSPPGGSVTPFSGLTDPRTGDSTANEIVAGEPFAVAVV